MKNKPLTYILIAAALGIWIYVFYFIFSVVSGEDDFVPVHTKKRTEDTTAVAQETYSLLLNYTDPFLKHRQSVNSVINHSGASVSGVAKKVSSEKHEQKKADLIKAGEADLAFCKTISYAGVIRNNAAKKNIAILTIEDREYMMAAGESVNGITLLKIATDSVEVKCRERKMYIKKGA